MRITAIRADPDYTPDGYKYIIKLDGVRLTHCITADDESGYVWIYVLDASGLPILEDDGTELVLRRLEGKVEIIPDGHMIKRSDIFPETQPDR